jgi:2',3'-cyclic-nucleotide 2'-phosphodiesterase (5'-nucleotidase family)
VSPSNTSSELDRALQKITEYKNELVAVVVHLNDTYQLEERKERKLPGFPRIIATVDRLRTHIKAETGVDRLLVVHSGDFLSPSLLARRDHGKAMVELLNKVGVDYCVLGNHEFDNGVKEELTYRLNEANFTVLLANATHPTGLIEVKRGAIWPEDHGHSPPLVALTGLVSADVHKSFEGPDPDPYIALVPPEKRKKWKWRFTPPNEALIEWLEELRSLERRFITKIPFRIVLTHATQNEDRLLRRQIPEMPRTYILGGHDHDIEWVEDDKEVFVMKNLSNAETVRVILLLAGGESVADEVFRTYQRLQARESAARDKTLQYPEDLEAVLLPASDMDSNVMKDRIKNAKPDTGYDDLYEAVMQAQFKPDILTFKLRYEDHEQAAQKDIDDVETALNAVSRKDDGEPVCDFSGDTAKLEARDAHIRRQQTNMGVFVAECVRRQADAKVAIIQAGAFRCDSELDAKLSVRDLRETFLFDQADAIMVLDLDSTVVDAFIKYGTQAAKGGTGAFAQVADERKGATGTVRIAISSYLLTGNNNDGYDAILQNAWGLPSIDKTHGAARNAIADEFSITYAVKHQGPHVSFIQPAGDADGDTSTIIGLLKTYADTFWAHIDPDRESSEKFRRWLGTDEPAAPSPEIEKARQAVRAFLRQLPGVAAYANESDWNSAWTAAEQQLEALQETLVGHDAVFRDRRDYARMFDMAARGMPGWFYRPD